MAISRKAKKTVTPANLRQVQRRLDRLEKAVKKLQGRGARAKQPGGSFTTVPAAD